MTERTSPISPLVDELWERRADLSPADEDARKVVIEAVDLLDDGSVRVATVAEDRVLVDERAKRAILLAFKVLPMTESAAGNFRYADRLPVKTRFDGVRVVPGAIARWGSHLEPGVVLMPSYTNIGARVGAGTLVDTWATVGSCAQIGERVHLSGGVGIGGVLEPVNAVPVVVEDDALVGSRAMITEGARVGPGAVVGAGVILNPSIPVIDVQTGAEVSRGRIPPYCVAVSGTRPREFPGGTFGLPCVLVIRWLAEGERHDKAQLNAVLREHGVAQ
ncbi:MAG: 2,3,4,5-tetrahydropyridine-2,6-dicarboxylate N-succinyltransferase [Mycobacteriales bacterium]